MRPTTIPPFFSIALTLLAAAACGYLNKDRLTTKPTPPAPVNSKVFHSTKQLNARNNHLDISNFSAFVTYQEKKTGFQKEIPKSGRSN